MARIYLAGRYSRREELCEVRDYLTARDHQVVARWLDGNHQLVERGISTEAGDAERARFAREDWEDMAAADWVISFTESPRAAPSRGGRHVEFGGALALRKRCIIVGPRENVFHHLPQVEWFPDWATCVRSGKF